MNIKREFSNNIALTIVLVLLTVHFSQNTISAQMKDSCVSGTFWNISTERRNYNSYSQQKTSLPISGGYPIIKSQSFVIGIEYNTYREKERHVLKFSISIPSSMNSDNGMGENHLLQRNKSEYFDMSLDYRWSFHLFDWNNLRVRHSFIAGALYEMRKLVFLSSSAEKTEDVNLYIGPGLQCKYSLSDKWKIEGIFDGRFYLPYLNYGKLTSTDSENAIIFSSSYRAFYYQTIFDAGITYRLSRDTAIKIGIKKNDLIGFANREPLFYVNDIVHFKLDRTFHYYIEYSF